MQDVLPIASLEVETQGVLNQPLHDPQLLKGLLLNLDALLVCSALYYQITDFNYFA